MQTNISTVLPPEALDHSLSTEEVEDDVDGEQEANTRDTWSLLKELGGDALKDLFGNLNEASKGINDGTDLEYRRYLLFISPWIFLNAGMY